MKGQPEASFEVVEGELREHQEYHILAGTLSARVYIKQANLECHDLLEKWMEPLSVWCRMKDLDPYEAQTLRYCWKLYMENHPHDSICGCSQDVVNDHMMDRYERLKEVAREIIDRKMTVLARQVDHAGFDPDDQKLVVANTAQLDSAAVRQDTIYFSEEDQVEDFRIEDERGNLIPYRIVSSQRSRKQVLSPINLPGVIHVQRFDIEWRPEAPASCTFYSQVPVPSLESKPAYSDVPNSD